MKIVGRFVLLSLVFAFCMGLTACGNKEGGTIEVINVGPDPSKVTIKINGIEEFNDVLSVGQSVRKSNNNDFTFSLTIQLDSNRTSLPNGLVTGGETIVYRRDGGNVHKQIK